MKIKVSDTTTLQLDWLVAKCEGKNGVLHDDGITRCIVIAAASGVYKGTFNPAINWNIGGPIIEREGLSIQHMGDDFENPWMSRRGDGHWEGGWASGSTPLVAAMHCFVVSKLGENVELPNELFN